MDPFCGLCPVWCGVMCCDLSVETSIGLLAYVFFFTVGIQMLMVGFDC